MAKIALAGGHSKAAPGASCYLNEYTEDRKINNALIVEMQKRGHTVTNCSNELGTQNAELAREVQLANNSGANVFCATHLNAFKKVDQEMGVEVWYYTGSSVGKKIATKMAKDLSVLLDIPNRGAKATTSLYVIRCTNMPAVLPEICFVDSKGDADEYNSVTTAQIASVMADAIESGVGKVKTVTTPSTGTVTTTTRPVTQTVDIDALARDVINGKYGTGADRKKALGKNYDAVQARVNEILSGKSSFKPYLVKITASVLNVRAGAGTGYKVKTTVKKNYKYTIVEEKMVGTTKWGKLKSGAGWISLAYTQKV